jgi:hypothetical protein
MNWGTQSCFGRFEKPPFCRKNQQTAPRSKKKTWQIHEMINQVSHREATGSQTAEKSEFCGLGRSSKGVRMQPTTGMNQVFRSKKTNNSMKTGPNEVESGLQAALWRELVKWLSLGWV